MKNPCYMIALSLLQLLLVSCSSSDTADTNIAVGTLSNLNVTAIADGYSEAQPNGDGSGMVSLSATAENAVGYYFYYPDGTSQYSETGIDAHLFRESGLNSYSIIVKAFGTNNSSLSQTITVSVNFTPVLAWQDEFDTGTSPSAENWTRETGGNGWGNNESQYYTTSDENSFLSNGMLHIVLKKQPFENQNYTSARLISHGKYQFTYGRIEIRAKLPTGGGTWPALWMLGSNFTSAPWPACGELDIMEQIGNDPGKVHGTLHHPGHFGANGSNGHTMVPDCSTEFHVYKADWSPTHIKFYVDDNLFYTFENNASLPFNHDFFLILNVAMGGNFGGAIDPAFVQSEMLVDYVRVYR
ncbi:MAG: glycoside hydrolase family 16 protein [Chitinophagaceae bacterium]|nr:MAG: glycoside hydrolase family 16 protein [Chitinophagaceae bacterium]